MADITKTLTDSLIAYDGGFLSPYIQMPTDTVTCQCVSVSTRLTQTVADICAVSTITSDVITNLPVASDSLALNDAGASQSLTAIAQATSDGFSLVTDQSKIVTAMQINQDSFNVQGAPKFGSFTATVPSSSLEGDNVTLSVAAFDLQGNAISGTVIIWDSNLDGFLGSGTSLSLSCLSVGTHVITVYGSGYAGQAQSTLAIIANTAPNRSENLLEQ